MKQRKDDKKSTFRMLTMVSQFGFTMLVTLGMTTLLGIWLDKKLGTSFITIVMFFLGAVAGGQNIYRMAKQIYGDEDRKNDKNSEKG